MPKRPCLRCGVLVERGSYCARHAPPPGWRARPSPSSLNRPTPAERKRAKLRAGNRCQDCGAAPTPSNPLQVDAVVPVAEGGDHSPSNTRVRCLRCHRRKTRADLRRQAANRRGS